MQKKIVKKGENRLRVRKNFYRIERWITER